MSLLLLTERGRTSRLNCNPLNISIQGITDLTPVVPWTKCLEVLQSERVNPRGLTQKKMWRRARKRVKEMKVIKRRPLLLQSEVTEAPAPQEKKKKKSNANNLPPDTYKDEIDPIDLYVDENRKFVISVKRGGELGLPMCDVRQYQTTEVYEGFTKKGINFPIALLPDLIEILQVVYGECDEKELV